jgi:TRAP-type mannitol/chloroaromatic compound transport system substrate-binding protein
MTTKTINRRHIFKATAVGIAGGTVVAAPALAQSQPEIRWRLTSGFPKSLDTIFGAGEIVARRVAELSGGRFQIQTFAAGEIVPGLQALDAARSGTVEMAGTAAFWSVGADPNYVFGTAVPFGLNARGQNAWLYQGGGQELLNEFYATQGVVGLTIGNTGCQMAGWFRREIKTIEDMRGLKMRIGGLAGQVLARMGAVPQQIAPGDIYPSLERGTIDAAEWIGPYDDEKLGFNKVAPFYYYPGFWEGGTMTSLFINKAKWDELPAAYRHYVQAAAHEANTLTLAKYDALNPQALRRLVAAGTQLRPISGEILEAAQKATSELFAEIGSRNATFKKIHDHMTAFRNEHYLWQQVAEMSYDAHMIRTRGRS